MSNKSKNEICTSLWERYKQAKAETSEVAKSIMNFLKVYFAMEVFHGAILEAKDAVSNAASSTYQVNQIQSLVLQKHGWMVEKRRLQFKTSADEIVRSMANSVILSMGFAEDGRVEILKTDGIEEFKIYAENPNKDLIKDQIVWITEPFVRADEISEAKTWTEMSKEDRENANKNGLIQSAASMPKYMQKRRALVASIDVKGDDRDAWIEYRLEAIEDFERKTFENDALAEELGIEKAQQKEEEAETETVADTTSQEQAIDATNLSEEVLAEAEEPETTSALEGVIASAIDDEANHPKNEEELEF